MRIWRHVQQKRMQDSGVLPRHRCVIHRRVLYCSQQKSVIIQLNFPQSQDLKYLHLNNLIEALEGDPDLVSLPRDTLCTVLP